MTDPKDIQWKSLPYRKWIRDNLSCYFCKNSLRTEKESYQGHHHRHSGGKRPRDHLITPLCLACHSELHANESRFNKKNNMTRERWDDLCGATLGTYLEIALNVDPRWIIINAEREAIKEAE